MHVSGECLVSPQAALRVSLPVRPAIPVYSGPASVSGTLPHDLLSSDLIARSGNTVILKRDLTTFIIGTEFDAIYIILYMHVYIYMYDCICILHILVHICVCMLYMYTVYDCM